MSSLLSYIVANINTSTVGLFVATLFTLYASQWIYRWRNPKCNGVLPPGSMGLPLIGETLELFIPSPFIDLPPFIKTRLNRYGSIFRTNMAGRPVIVSADLEFNDYILRQDGKSVEAWALDTFAKVFEQASQSAKKYPRNVTLSHFGVETIKDKLIPEIDGLIRKTLHDWSTKHDSIELKGSTIKMTIEFGSKQLFSGDLDHDSTLKLGDMFKNFMQGLMAIPVNIPGTMHHKCSQIQNNVRSTVRNLLKNRLSSTPDENRQQDMLDHMIKDMNTQDFLTQDFIVQLLFGLLFVSADSISTTLALAFKLLEEHPLVLEELIAEHEAILKKRENLESPVTWDEYKSMTFTLQVINEVLRISNVSPGLFRRALQDIPVNGYTIPKGWVIMIATAALHMDPNQFEDPLAFNPSRWKKMQSNELSRSFMPFGVGRRQCAGAEYSRFFIATFLHVLVTKYRWGKVKGKIVRAPILRFPNGLHCKISEKTN